MARHGAADRSRPFRAAFEPPKAPRGRLGSRRLLAAAVLPLALALLIVAPSAACALTWSDYGSNPVIAGGHNAYYPDMSYDAAAFSGHGTSAYYKAWYDDGANTWLAYSNDAKTWTDFGTSPVLTAARHPKVLYDAAHFGNDAGDFVNGASGPTYSVTPYYKMWFWEMPHKIGFAYSADGVTWQTDYTADVLPHEAFPYWSQAPVYGLEIVRIGSGFQGWADNNGRFYNVSSPDGITWTVGSMALDVGALGAWDDGSLSRCSVIYVPEGGAYATGWYMFYGGTGGLGGGGNQGIGVARSNDGLTWTRDPANPSTVLGGYGPFGGLGAPGTWTENRNYAMSVLYSADDFGGHGDPAPIKMLRSGRTNAGVCTIGLAMATPDAGPAVVPASSWWSLGLIGAAGLLLLVLRTRRTQAG